MAVSMSTYIEFQYNTKAVSSHRNEVCSGNDEDGYSNMAKCPPVSLRWHMIWKETVLYNFTRHKTLNGKGEQDCNTEADAWNIHQVVIPAVILQKVTCWDHRAMWIQSWLVML